MQTRAYIVYLALSQLNNKFNDGLGFDNKNIRTLLLSNVIILLRERPQRCLHTRRVGLRTFAALTKMTPEMKDSNELNGTVHFCSVIAFLVVVQNGTTGVKKITTTKPKENYSRTGNKNEAYSTSLSQKQNRHRNTNIDKGTFHFHVFCVLSYRCACDVNPTHYILQFCVSILKIGLESLAAATVDLTLDEQKE